MLHFGLACNMYSATGASLKGVIASPDLVPAYPTNGLPGGVHPGLVVSLVPLSTAALQTFMSIEYPDLGPVVQQPPTPPPPAPPAPPTIGQFYQTIAAGFNTVYQTTPWPNNPSLHQVSAQVDSDQLFAINSVTDALQAITEITQQGEGTSASPDEGTLDSGELAHYYQFAQIYYGAMVAKVGTGFQYSGAAVSMPKVFNFAPLASADQTDFTAAFTKLMTQLEACWTTGASIQPLFWGAMGDLQNAGVTLIQALATPQFAFQATGLPAHA